MRNTTCSMAPRSEPAGEIDAAARASDAPAAAVSPRLAAARTAAPPPAIAAASSVRRSKRRASLPTAFPLAPNVSSHRRDQLGSVVLDVPDALAHGMVDDGARRRRTQQGAQVFGVLVGRGGPQGERRGGAEA